MSHPRYTLRELEAEYWKSIDDKQSQIVDTLAEADGLCFLCPRCFHKNGGRVGTHIIICWFVGRVPNSREPGPGRWTPQGTGLDDLTFVPSAGLSQSVLLTGGCQWHGYVTDGCCHEDGSPPREPRRNPEYVK